MWLLMLLQSYCLPHDVEQMGTSAAYMVGPPCGVQYGISASLAIFPYARDDDSQYAIRKSSAEEPFKYMRCLSMLTSTELPSVQVLGK